MFKVAKVLDDFTLIINAGENFNILKNQRFIIVSPDEEEIFDPDTHESLGFMERIVGTGKVTDVFPEMSKITSDMKQSYKLVQALSGQTVVTDDKTGLQRSPRLGELIPKPFSNPQIGNIARPI